MTNKYKILVVDDTIEIRRLLTVFITKKLGYEVVTAASGQEGIDLMQKGQHFDLVLLDQMMPGMAGTDMLISMEFLNLKIPPTIMITANSSTHLAVEFMKIAGATDYQEKPLDLAILKVKIDNILHKDEKEEESYQRFKNIFAGANFKEIKI
ncbi:MAG: response regulator [Candidatus Anammoxibacter sp.]